uniref:Myosin motor domain-containing protein n=1 Tax=Spongospora subterranea TaxID=70186 RepID=A0A0H5R950_9EUKA|eukprot:CRZ10237.1 hypothetical protein [Spongospora subterranea]
MALYSKQSISDLVLLSKIDESSILATLKARHAINDIYTYIGNVLLSVNPFKSLNIYGDAYISKYRGRYMYEHPPHIYAIAEESITAVRSNHVNQCVIISGESGAGKTEASKLFMQYIAAVSSDMSEIKRIKDQILQTSAVLESFGNACTRKNSNSSRFGKYMEIAFNFRSDPIGGTVSNFLLEKSRVVQVSEGERSFHIFYQLTRGANALIKTQYFLEAPEYFNYLSKSKYTEVKGTNDKDDFKMTLGSLAAMDIPTDVVSEILRVISAILWIGQIQYVKSGDNAVIVDTDDAVGKVSNLLQCKPEQLRSAFLFRSVNAGREAAIQTPLDLDQGYFTRDAFAKLVYDRLFSWIIQRINTTIAAPDAETVAKIGILDIYGFEVFTTNSFEQLCINYANEKLQQVFIARTLQAEQQEYDVEGISWQHIEYFDNKIVVDLIEKKPYGILAYLDEACMIPKGTVATFISSLTDAFSTHDHLSMPKQLGQVFTIAHYAGNVTYDADLFLIKNKDLVWSDLLELGENCDLTIMKTMFFKESGSANQKRPLTAGAQFKVQVNQLADKLNSCQPHYIRCIKPNEEKRTGYVDEPMVLHQIKYLGLLENVRVRRAGFAYRMEYSRFLARYKMLSPATWPIYNKEASQGTRLILQEMKVAESSQFVMGKTKVFIREPISLFALEEFRSRRLQDLATLIQKVYRSWVARKYYKELRERAVGLFGDQKLRRVKSFNRNYFGDYEGGSSQPSVEMLLTKNRDSRILFFDKVLKVNRRMKTQNRLLLLTENSLYNLTSKFKLKRKISLAEIQGISLSPYADNLMVVHVPNEYDYVYTCERKTEFVTALSDQYLIILDKKLPIRFTKHIAYTTKNKQKREILVELDPSLNDELLLEPIGSTIKVHVGNIPTVSATSVRSKQAGLPTGSGHIRRQSMNPGIILSQPANPQVPPRNSNVEYAVGLFDFNATDATEISFKKGDTLVVLQQLPDGWFQVDFNGKLGYAPGNHLKLTKPTSAAVIHNRQASRQHGALPKIKELFSKAT